MPSLDYANKNCQSRSFRKQDLREANFKGADLRNCNFRRKDLSGANFIRADLRGCDFSNAILVRTNFQHARFGQTQKQIWIELAIALALSMPYLVLFPLFIMVDYIWNLAWPFAIVNVVEHYLIKWANQYHVSHLILLHSLSWILSILILILLGLSKLVPILSTPTPLFVAMVLFSIAFYFATHVIDSLFRSHSHPRPGTRFNDANLKEALFATQTPEQSIHNVDFTGAILERVDFSQVSFGGIRCDYYYTSSSKRTDKERSPELRQFTPLQARYILDQLNTLSHQD